MASASGVSYNAELNREIQKALYDDVYRLVQAWQSQSKSPENGSVDLAEIGFHFYEGLARLFRKLQGSPHEPARQVWAIAEELRLLFDAHAVIIDAYAGDERDLSVEPAWRAATITSDEEECLQAIFKTAVPNPNNRSAVVDGMGSLVWDSLGDSIGALSLPNLPRNSNLQAVDGRFTARVFPQEAKAESAIRCWELVALIETQGIHRAEFRSREFCTFLLPDDEPLRKRTAEAFLKALSRLRMPQSLPQETTRSSMESLLDHDDELLGSTREPSEFLSHYERRFSPIANVLNILSRRIATLLETSSEELPPGSEPTTFTFLFSFFNSRTETISFFPLANHEVWADDRIPFVDLRAFFTFRYRPALALNGWVLSTGFCDYTEGFTEDPRWEIPTADSPDTPDLEISRQRETGRLVFKGDSQPFAFLLPLYSEWLGEAQKFRPLLMLSITRSVPFGRPLRRQILDHAWNAFHETEMALMAQEELNKAHKLERQAGLLHLNRALGHSLPKFVFKPLEYYSLVAHRQLAPSAARLKAREIGEGGSPYSTATSPMLAAGEAPSSADLILRRQLFSIQKGTHYLRSLLETFDDVTDRRQTASLHEVFSDLATAFSEDAEIYLKGRLDAYDTVLDHDRSPLRLRDLARATPFFHFEFLLDGVHVEAGSPREFAGPQLLVRGDLTTLTMHLHNVVENAINSFSFEDLTDADGLLAADFNGHTARLEATSADGYVTVTATDSGTRIDSTVLSDLQTMITAALTIPQWETTTFAQELLERIRRAGSSEGSGQGLMRLAQYVRSLWAGNPREDAMQFMQDNTDPLKKVVIRLPSVETDYRTP